MQRASLASIALWMMLVVGAVVGVAMLLLPENRSWIAFGIGLVVAVVLGGVFRWRVYEGMRELDVAIARLPEFEAEENAPGFVEAEDIKEGLQEVSTRVQDRLRVARRERRQLEALLDSMQDAVVAVDAAGRIQWTNERMRRLIPGNPAGSPVRVGHALVQTIRDPDALECVRIALKDKANTVRRSISLWPGRIFEVSASPMPGGGAVAVLHDITRIEEVERTQRDFVANVSHELRTPLTSISGYVETLMDHEIGVSEQGREFLATILKNATRMTRLTEDLLVMARVEGPGASLNPAALRSDLLVGDAVESLQGLAQETEAILKIGAMTQTQIYADADSVMQVLGNLIENAIKYGQPRNGSRSRVEVSTRDIAEPIEAVEFCVRDFGTGIASEHLERIFERFYRVDKTRSRESGGTGLGLSIARHMVQSQGGTIRAESELGNGSRFLFTLPKALYPVNED